MIKLQQIIRFGMNRRQNFLFVCYHIHNFIVLELRLIWYQLWFYFRTKFLNILKNSSFEPYVPDFIFNFSNFEAIVFFSIAIIITYIVKNLILLVATYSINLFVGKINSKIQKKND